MQGKPTRSEIREQRSEMLGLKWGSCLFMVVVIELFPYLFSMALPLDRDDHGVKRESALEVVARSAVKKQLITIAASNDNVSVSALVEMLDRLKRATQRDLHVVVDGPSSNFIQPANDIDADPTRSVNYQLAALQWCVDQGVSVSSLSTVTPPQIVDGDPWQLDPGVAIRHWHSLARELDRVRVEVPRYPIIVGVFKEWTASRRGISRSIRHVAKPITRTSIHMGSNIPVSVDPDVGQASYSWVVPIR